MLAEVGEKCGKRETKKTSIIALGKQLTHHSKSLQNSNAVLLHPLCPTNVRCLNKAMKNGRFSGLL